MDKRTCKRLSKVIKSEDILDMLKEAKNGIKDWTKASRLNPMMSIGYTWNILASKFVVTKPQHTFILKQLLCEFGDWLTIKPYMEPYLPKPKERYKGEVCHREPDFSNFND